LNIVSNDKDFELDDLQIISQSVENFVRKTSTLKRIRELRASNPGYDLLVWNAIAEQGWLGTLVPVKYGGLELGSSAMCMISEGLSRGLFPEPVTASAVFAMSTILYGKNDELKSRLLPQIVSGALIAGVAYVDNNNNKLLVKSLNNTYVLNGSKLQVIPAYRADGYVVKLATDLDSILLWVPFDTKGLSVSVIPLADGSQAATLLFKSVILAEKNVIAKGQDAELAFSRAMDKALLSVSAELLGVMDQALNMTLDYLKVRIQFGKHIGSFQALQHRVVDLFILKELSVSALAEAIKFFDSDSDHHHQHSLVAARLKSRCSDSALMITREGIKLFGAIGFTDDCDIGLYLQRALVLSAWLGNAATQRRKYSKIIRDHVTIAPARGVYHDPFVDSPPGTEWNDMTDDEFRKEIRRYFEMNYPNHLRYLNRRARWSETKDWAHRMSQKGWIAPAWPREFGGMGLSPSKLIIWMEEQERWGIARAPDQGILLLGPVLMRYGTKEQIETYLPKIISCEHIWAQGYSEPNAGSDLASLRTESIADGDFYVINGIKIWSTLAQDATHIFLLARTDKAVKKQLGISFFLVDVNTPGISIRPIRNIEGHEEFCEIFFTDVRIPKRNLIGELNNGWTIAKTLLGFERLNHGSPRRVQYPLLKIEMIARQQGLWNDSEFQSKYVKLRLDTEDLAAAYARFADIVRSGRNPGPVISFLKIWATETFQNLTEMLIEIAGELGSVRGEIDFGADIVDILGPYYCVFPATIAAGSNEIQRNIIARHVLHLPNV